MMDLELYEDALQEYSQYQNIEPQTKGLAERINAAKLKVEQRKKRTLYDTLGVDIVTDSSKIKIAYKLAALEWHPDKHSLKSPVEQKSAEAKFKAISEAYSVLSDPQKRQQYDLSIGVS